MKMLTDELFLEYLDLAVAIAEGRIEARIRQKRCEVLYKDFIRPDGIWGSYLPSVECLPSVKIIHREKISTVYDRSLKVWIATAGNDGEFTASGETMLIAAMRAYVKSKLGNEVDFPSDLFL